MAYLYLALAILTEVAATSTLKATAEFTRLLPSLVVVAGYGASIYLLTLVLRSLPIGITYAVWAGMGIVLVALVGVVIYREVPDWPGMLGMAMIVGGVVVIHLFSKTVSH